MHDSTAPTITPTHALLSGDAPVTHEPLRGTNEDALLARLALALANTDSIELAVAVTLQEICEATGCVLGEAWIPRAEMAGTQRMHRVGTWSRDEAALREFVTKPESPMGLGEGMVGNAWKNRGPVWIADVHDPTAVVRAATASAAGLRAAVAIPLMIADEVAAVLAFFQREPHEDPALVRLITAVATPLGTLLLQKQIEESHRAMEAKLAGMIAIAADAIVSTDHARNITLFNSGAVRIFGYVAEEMIGESIERLFPAESRATYAALTAQLGDASTTAVSLGQRVQIMGRRKNGEIFPAEASLSRFATAGEWTYTMILRDVSDRVRTEVGLRFLSETSAVLAETLEDFTPIERVARLATPVLGDFCVIDVVGASNEIRTVAIAAVNPEVEAAIRAFRARTATTTESLTPVAQAIRSGEPVVLANAPEWWGRVRSELAEHAGIVARLGVRSQITLPLRARGRVIGALTLSQTTRTFHPFELSLADGLAVRLALAMDNAMLYRHMRDAVAARDETLAVVSHDLRNPLSAISMCLSGLQDDPTQPIALAQGLVGTAQESAELMHRMIQDLLDIASIDAGHLSLDRARHPVGDVMHHAVTLLQPIAEDRELTLTLEMDGLIANTPVEVDAERITQVMSNLIGNACKFTEPPGEVRVAVHGMGDAVRISVADTGCGIPSGALPHVFDRFWHARRGARQRSTGLGLAVARGIVEAHGGRIWAESVEGSGSTFSFTLPLISR
jgi:PAS domain S-box-containing protein